MRKSVFSCGELTRCDSSKVRLRLARRKGPTLEELLSFIEEYFWTRLFGEETVAGIIDKFIGEGSAVAPLGMIGIVRGDG